MILQQPIAIAYANISAYSVAQDFNLWDVNYNGGAGYAVGDQIIVEDCGCKVYESSIDSNTTDPQSADQGEWFVAGVSNWAAQFDDLSSTQTINDDLVEYTLSADELVTGLSFINIEAASLSVTVKDGADVTIQQLDYDLLKHNAYDYRDWFLRKPSLIKRVDIDNIEPTINGSITIRFENSGAQVKVGQVSWGYRHTIGACEWGGIQPRIFTFSEINEDTFGNISISQRLKKRDITYQVQVSTGYLSEVIDLVEQYQDKPALFIGTGDYQGSFVFGLVQDFSPVYDNLIDSPYSLTIKGYA